MWGATSTAASARKVGVWRWRGGVAQNNSRSVSFVCKVNSVSESASIAKRVKADCTLPLRYALPSEKSRMSERPVMSVTETDGRTLMRSTNWRAIKRVVERDKQEAHSERGRGAGDGVLLLLWLPACQDRSDFGRDEKNKIRARKKQTHEKHEPTQI